MAEYDKWAGIYDSLKRQAQKEGISWHDAIKRYHAEEDENTRKIGERKIKSIRIE